MKPVLLGDFIERKKSIVDKDSTDLLYYVGGEHIDSGRINIKKRGVIKGSTIGPAFHTRFDPGDVLLMSRNPHLRKAGIVDFEGICSDVTYVCRTKDESRLLQSFIPFIFQSNSFWRFAEENKKGSTNFFLNWSDFEKYELFLPNIEIQKKLSDTLWSIENTIEAYKNLLFATDELVNAQFLEVFGDETNPYDWPVKNIEEVAKVSVGVVIKPAQYYTKESNGVKAFRSLNIGPMKIKDSDWVYFTTEGNEKNKKSQLKENDLLIVRSGAPGTACVVPKKYEGCNAVDLIIARPDTTQINPYYLCAYTNMPHGKQQIDRGTDGAAQQHFNVGKYNKLKIMLPPMEIQNEFIRFVNKADESKMALERTIESLSVLKNEIIDQSFEKGCEQHEYI